MRSYLVYLMLLATACGAQASPTAQSTPSAAVATAVGSAAATGVATATAVLPARAQILTATPAATQTLAPAVPTVGAPLLSEYTADNGDRVLGRPGAPITMLDYSDFQ
jgi:hypothetical protein